MDEKIAKVRRAWETEAAIRNAKAFYCLLVKMEGARVNSSVTAGRLLYFSVFRFSVWSRCLGNFVTVLMSALLLKFLPFEMKTFTLHNWQKLILII
jgi:hypothetical protein